MVTVFESSSADLDEQREVEALEHVVRALCEHVARLVDAARFDERLGTREAHLQVAAFEERRRRALRALETDTREPCSIRIGNLEKLVDALDCSRLYFAAAGPERPSERSPH